MSDVRCEIMSKCKPNCKLSIKLSKCQSNCQYVNQIVNMSIKLSKCQSNCQIVTISNVMCRLTQRIDCVLIFSIFIQEGAPNPTIILTHKTCIYVGSLFSFQPSLTHENLFGFSKKVPEPIEMFKSMVASPGAICRQCLGN